MTARFAIERDLVLMGGGGHGRVLAQAIELLGGWIIAVNDPRLLAEGSSGMGPPILSDHEVLARCPPDRVLLVNGVGSTGPAEARHDLARRWRERGYRFATIVHPGALVAADAALGEGVQVMAGAVVQTAARIGADGVVNTRASVDHDCVLEETVHLAPGVTLSGGVAVGALSHLGTGAVAIQGVRIGRRCLVGAGAVVVGDLDDDSRVAPGVVAGARPAAKEAGRS